MRTRNLILLTLGLVASCSRVATYTGSVSIEGIEVPDPNKLHWGTAVNEDWTAPLGEVTPEGDRARTTASGGRLQYEFGGSPGPIDIAFWYDANGNGALDSGDKTFRVAERVQGIGNDMCRNEKTVVPHAHLSETFAAPSPAPAVQPDTSDASPTAGRLQPCAIDLHVTGQIENHGGAEVDERVTGLSVMSHDHLESPKTMAPIPLLKSTVVELDLETKEDAKGRISFEGPEGEVVTYTFGGDGRPSTIEIDPVADPRDFTYTYAWDCSGRAKAPAPAYHDDIALDEP